jgi:hypothetical protein
MHFRIIRFDLQGLVVARDGLSISRQLSQHVTAIVVRCRVVRLDPQSRGNQLQRLSMMSLLKPQNPEQMKRLDVIRTAFQKLPVDPFSFRNLSPLMEENRLLEFLRQCERLCGFTHHDHRHVSVHLPYQD